MTAATRDVAAVKTQVGDHVRLHGELVRVQSYSSRDVTVLDLQQKLVRRIDLAVFLAESWPCTADGVVVAVEQELSWEFASEAERAGVLDKIRDLMWVVSGAYCDTNEELEKAKEAPGCSQRVAELARRRRVSQRSIWRDKAAWRDGGVDALIRGWSPQYRASKIDPRWAAKLQEVVARYVNKSDISRKLVLEVVSRELEIQYGRGIVRVPGESSAYDYIKRVYRGTNAFNGSAKGKRSIAERPEISLGQLHPTRPGEYVIMDTHIVDVFAMEATTKLWVQCQLTVAQDLYTRAIVGLSVTPVSTKSVDVATVLFEVCHPGTIRGDTVPRTSWPYRGVPENIVFTERSDHWGMPLVATENLVVDNGRAFISRHVMDVCHRRGISVLPAQPYKPTDKPTVERFFRTLREDLIARLPGYKGPDVYSRGLSPETEAFYFTHEIETLIRHWITRRYHRKPHSGLVDPRWPHEELSPNTMYELAIDLHGLPRMAANPNAFIEFLPLQWRKMMHYGFQIDKRKYRSVELNQFEGRESPYGGVHAGQWPIRYNPDDIRRVYIQHPTTFAWHTLTWEHAHKFDLPLSRAAYDIMRKRWDQVGEPADDTYDLMSEFLATTELSRKDRNTLIRSVHHAQQQRDGTSTTSLYADGANGQADTAMSRSDEPDWNLAWSIDDADDEDCADTDHRQSAAPARAGSTQSLSGSDHCAEVADQHEPGPSTAYPVAPPNAEHNSNPAASRAHNGHDSDAAVAASDGYVPTPLPVR